MPPVAVTVAAPLDWLGQVGVVRVMVAVGLVEEPTFTEAVVGEHAPLLVTVTVYVPGVKLTAVEVVCPLLHT